MRGCGSGGLIGLIRLRGERGLAVLGLGEPGGRRSWAGSGMPSMCQRGRRMRPSCGVWVIRAVISGSESRCWSCERAPGTW